jgi:predicted ferric reductase
MSHDHSQMSDMGSMGMGSMGDSGGFLATNTMLAQSLWYLIAGVVGLCLFIRVVDYAEMKTRLRIARTRSVEYPTRSRGTLSQAYATITAISRELSAPEYHIRNRWLSWLSPPPLGRCILLGVYWAVIIYMMRWDAVIYDAYFWERIAYRAAWISVTQVPLVYLLAMKSSIIGFLSGTSHERLNWLHRWVSRTLLITVTVHGGHFYTEWVRSGNIGTMSFVEFELQLMPMVKYGMGAWFVLLWTFLSSLAPIRRWSYEIFVLQHLAAAGVFLWLLWLHVPSYAVYNIWFAIGAVAFDKVFLFCWSSWANVRLRPTKSEQGVKSKLIGHHAEIRALDDETTEVVVKDIPFSWKPGQHVYLRLPTMSSPLESHPFTIANVRKTADVTGVNDVQLIIQAQKGFTRRLHRKAEQAPGGSKLGMTAILTGPFGCPPAWNFFETLVLISASTGASFVLPILEDALANNHNSCVTRIDLLAIVRRRCGIQPYLHRLRRAANKADGLGISLNVTIAITGEADAEFAEFVETSKSTRLEGCRCGDNDEAPSSSSTDSDSITEVDDGKKGSAKPIMEKVTRTCCCGRGNDRIDYTCGRPDIAAFIRPPVEATGGETCVAVCGGNSLVAVVRNGVAALSDERAVHKGTGAQGIALHTEHYCF